MTAAVGQNLQQLTGCDSQFALNKGQRVKIFIFQNQISVTIEDSERVDILFLKGVFRGVNEFNQTKHPTV